MTFTNEPQMPRDWPTLILGNVMNSFLFPGLLVWIAVAMAMAGELAWTVVLGLLTFATFQRKDARAWRMQLYLRLRQREAIRLSKFLHEGFRQLEEGQLYAAQDVTTGHEFRVVFTENSAYVIDPTGCFLFDPTHWPIAVWAESEWKMDFFSPQPATSAQLKALRHRLRTYR